MKKTSLMTVLLTVLAFGAAAQEKATHSEADYQAVYQLFDAANIKASMESKRSKMLDLQIRNVPMLAAYRDDLLDFMNKYTSYEVLKKELADIHLKYYTMDDLKELAKFYTTPIGQKFLRINEQLTADIMELSMSKVMANKDELQQIITQKMKNTEKDKNNGAEK
jgi:hypothetical protein